MNNQSLINRKILKLEALSSILAVWRFQQKKIVFTNGCFDILHLGHVDYLAKAKDLGDILILGLNSDASVKKLKGESRPVVNEHARASLLASLFFVDVIVFFNDDTPYDLIKIVKPDILVKGSDYKEEEIVGYDIVKSKGGKIITIDFLEGYSTSSIIQKLKNG